MQESKKFIRHMEKQCGDEPSFVILLKYNRKKDGIQRITDNADEILLDEDVITQVKYNGIKISLYKTGKIILHGIDEEEEAKRILAGAFGETGN